MAKDEKPDNAFNSGPCHAVKKKRHNQNKGHCTNPHSYPKKQKNATWTMSPKNYAWTKNEKKLKSRRGEDLHWETHLPQANPQAHQ